MGWSPSVRGDRPGRRSPRQIDEVFEREKRGYGEE